PEPPAPGASSNRVEAGAPRAFETARLFGRLVQRAIGRRWHRGDEPRPWLLGIRPHRPGPPDGEGFTPYLAPRDRYWADPFLFRQNGTTHLFFEDFQPRRARGEIAWAAVGADGRLPPTLEPEIVLSCGHHLAYPLVFEHRGSIYLMPDNEGIGG